MSVQRREFFGAAAAAILLSACRMPMDELEAANPYGVIGQMMAARPIIAGFGTRAELQPVWGSVR